MYFSKSKYTAFRGCPKCCWLDKYKPTVKETNASVQNLFNKGHEVGELAKGYFGDYVDMTTYNADGSLNLGAMVQKTKIAIADGVQNICEAAFDYDGLYCAVDVLHKDNDGYAIYEVKSSTVVKDYHYSDVAYQKYVLEKCGIKVTGAHVVVLNNKYVLNGELDVRELFSIDGGKDISSHIQAEYGLVEDNLSDAERIMSSEKEPNVDIGKQCGDWCGYWNYCTRHLPKPNIFDLYNCRKKTVYYNKGIISFEDIAASGIELSDVQKRQVEYALSDKGVFVDKPKIKEFLDTLTYPLYFLDFETMQVVVPEIEGTSPYQNIPFQYSLHFVESQTSEAQHREFLAESGTDPRRALAERLCEDIPKNVCTLAFHAGTERGIIERLADQFPDLKEHLLNIASGIKDLLPIFQKYYYRKEIGGSFSIKSILPAICPDKDYHNLEGVQNGTDALSIFPAIKDMPPEEAQKARQQLLIYCGMDTLATVILWQELVEVSK